jgi:hypothetical protein
VAQQAGDDHPAGDRARPRRRVSLRAEPGARDLNPQAEGSPNVSGNRPQAYYPGDRYVDLVGHDI